MLGHDDHGQRHWLYQWLPSGAEPYVVTQENCENPSAKVQIPQPFREGRCAPRQSNLGKVISLVRSLLIRAHGNPQLRLSTFQR